MKLVYISTDEAQEHVVTESAMGRPVAPNLIFAASRVLGRRLFGKGNELYIGDGYRTGNVEYRGFDWMTKYYIFQINHMPFVNGKEVRL